MNGSASKVQWTNTYPFGMSYGEGQSLELQPYKYTGKEYDNKHGLNLYDYDARFYDPALGRFMTMDPLAEKYYSISPYAYCGNNPIIRIDPDGRDWYRHDESGATFWQEGNAVSVTTNNQSYRNIGAEYSQYSDGLQINYHYCPSKF
ncbi:RHS repeat-associated protein [Parabacteroides sp. PFB2-10]|uniref:RHS repeat-associated core domain-containing protein n=1 Tax=Parabacteroides sp. PFB2-10 TaxID=1742405 RepID=UPI0024730E40|nr:RHS repeat-associated core domain-containing protein [Parabacteroides sp. PFB2-10]MDH6312259.1 RHS repeat-associated protein [Parabacteroides sp. PFB2-10]